MNLTLKRYSIILSLLFFHFSAASKSSFYPIPVSPRLGEKVFLFCELEADESQFSSIVPDLIVDIVGTHQFHFNAISSELGDRYYGYDIPDLNRIRMQGFIFISSLNESDLSINFTCLQTLLQNDKVISASLILNNFHTPQNSINPTQSLTSHIMPSTTSLNPSIASITNSPIDASSEDVGKSPEATTTPGISDTPMQTTSTLTNPTPATEDGFTFPLYETVMGTITSICLIFIVILCIVVCIAYLIRYFTKKRNDDVSTELNPMQLQSISDIPSGSESFVCTTSFESLNDTQSFKSCNDTQSFKSCNDTQSFISSFTIPTQDNPSNEESCDPMRRLNSGETQKSGQEENI